MTFEAFKNRIASTIQLSLPEGTKVTLQRITKNNNTVLDGLVITEPDTNLSPTIYLNPYYENAYMKGVDWDTIIRDITAQYFGAKPVDFSVAKDFIDYEKIKDRIVFRMVNHAKNSDRLNDIPHVDFLDFALTFSCLVDLQGARDASIQIRHEHLSSWNIDITELCQRALSNTPRLLPPICQNMAELIPLSQFKDEPIAVSPEDLAFPMYVLTNEAKLFGATCLYYDGLLRKLSKRFEDDLFIIPSSIHEVILLPAGKLTKDCDLNAMIREVNATQLAPDEYLSDHAYFYSAANDEITVDFPQNFCYS